MSTMAKFPAICPLCGKKITPGKDMVKPHPNYSNVKRWVHTSCAGGATQQRLFK